MNPRKALLLLLTFVASVNSFAPSRPALLSTRTTGATASIHATTGVALQSAATEDDICRIQILMSDTGGGHRASANALRDAFDVLHPGKIECDIVDIFTEYGPFWPYNDYPRCYKIMAEYSFLWEAFYRFGETAFGLALNEFLMEKFCFDAFSICLARPSGSSKDRADMVISVHPLCQDVPLKILSNLDSNGATRTPEARTTPFCTVVTDLGGAHPTWFNKK
jgi:1,2-diacylglycerol 3-beta-galactosyltransferase